MIKTGVVERWLRKQTLLEAFLNVPVGMICLTASLVALAFVTALAFVVGFVLSQIAGALVNPFLELDDRFPLFFSAIFSAAFLVWLFISHYRRSAAYRRFSKYRKPRVHVFEAGFGRALNALLSGPHVEDGIFKSIIYTGPQWFVSAISMFYKSVTLPGMDIKSCAKILIILFQKGSRVSLADLAKLMPECNAPKVFPQLRNIAGVIFLESEPTGISITSDLRAELARLLGVKMRPQPEPRYYRQTKSAPPPPRTPPKPIVEELAGPHTILGVSRTASLAEIKAAYRKQIKLCHPDKFATLNKDWQRMADQRAKTVNAAYALLLDQVANRRART